MTGSIALPSVAQVKPRLRGWLHAVGAPVAIAFGVLLLVLAQGTRAQVGSGVYAASLVGLLTVSAVYHRGRWRPAARAWWQRVDHAMIFVLIAGTYTPFCLLVLDGTSSIVVLSVVWGGAILGVVTRLLWWSAPKWLFVPLYIGLGWTAIVVAPALAAQASLATTVLLVTGGVLYTVGAIVFATQRPDPWPRTFGFHEVFHALTLLAAAAHAAALLTVLL